MAKLNPEFFQRDANQVAKDLLGKVIRRLYKDAWLSVRIVETESYYLNEKASHSSLGFTQKRSALFSAPGTIYMYYAHGRDSLNLSCLGAGNAVLIKSGYPYFDNLENSQNLLEIMRSFHTPTKVGMRAEGKLCSGQTLLCTSLQLKVVDWNNQQFSPSFFIEDIKHSPSKIIQTTRLGIPKGRDEHLMQRFIDFNYTRFCTSNPLTKRGWRENEQYRFI